jgi:hypothetical protein
VRRVLGFAFYAIKLQKHVDCHGTSPFAKLPFVELDLLSALD